jgi:hypothetical protein
VCECGQPPHGRPCPHHQCRPCQPGSMGRGWGSSRNSEHQYKPYSSGHASTQQHLLTISAVTGAAAATTNPRTRPYLVSVRPCPCDLLYLIKDGPKQVCGVVGHLALQGSEWEGHITAQRGMSRNGIDTQARSASIPAARPQSIHHTPCPTTYPAFFASTNLTTPSRNPSPDTHTPPPHAHTTPSHLQHACHSL